MSKWVPQSIKRVVQKPLPFKIVNKTFYSFLFSFVAVIAGVLLLILVLGSNSGLQ